VTRNAKVREMKKRILILMALIGLFFLVLFAQIMRLQALAQKSGSGTVSRVAGARGRGPAGSGTGQRGTIVDSNGYLVVADDPQWVLSATPINIRPKDTEEIAGKLSQITGIPEEKIAERIDKARKQGARYVELSDTPLPWDVGMKVLKVFPPREYRNIVTVTLRPKRVYGQGDLFGGITGFYGWNQSGRHCGIYGVEGFYDAFLTRGGFVPEADLSEAQALPEKYAGRYLPSVVGHDLILTVDRNIQYIVEDELKKAVERYKGEKGIAVVMDPYTGDILAMAAYPPLKPTDPHPAISQPFEPGSVFKVVTAAAALDSGTVTMNQVFTDTGKIEIGGKYIQNAEKKAYGRVTIREVMYYSLNVEAAKMALDMGPDTFYNYLHRFGVGEKTEIDMTPESDGFVRWPVGKRWSEYDLAANSFGQGLSATVLQMVTAVAAIANGGNLVRPHVVKALVVDGKYIPYGVSIKRRQIIKKDTARKVTELMTIAARIGRKDLIPGYSVAGKTGTAQVPTEHGYDPYKVNTSFVGFVPAKNPRFVCMVTIMKPKWGGWATVVAAPTFKAIAERILYYMKVPPDNPRNLNGTG